MRTGQERLDHPSLLPSGGLVVTKTVPDLDEVYDELYRLISFWTLHEDIRETERRTAVRIGKAFYDIGGERLMRDAYYNARARNRAASVLNLYWNGIGDWLS